MSRFEKITHPEIPEIETVVIGGGIVGTCLATFLAEGGPSMLCPGCSWSLLLRGFRGWGLGPNHKLELAHSQGTGHILL